MRVETASALCVYVQMIRLDAQQTHGDDGEKKIRAKSALTAK